jgi:hypothetical protein
LLASWPENSCRDFENEAAISVSTVEVEWPDRRTDVLNALELMSAGPPLLASDDSDNRWPNLTNAVHWLVDDTTWDINDPSESVGLILLNEHEADAVRETVSAVVEVGERQGSEASDGAWFGDPEWGRVRSLARSSADLLRAGGDGRTERSDP